MRDEFPRYSTSQVFSEPQEVKKVFEKVRSRLDKYVAGMSDEKEALCLAIVGRLNCCLEGGTGGGKTLLAEITMKICDIPYGSMHLHKEIREEELGLVRDIKAQIKDGKFRYNIDYPLNQQVVIMHELSRAPAWTTNFLLEILRSGTYRGEKVPPFLYICTFNPHDEETYIGTYRLDRAPIDRFPLIVSSSNILSMDTPDNRRLAMEVMDAATREFDASDCVGMDELTTAHEIVRNVAVPAPIKQAIIGICFKVHGSGRREIAPSSLIHCMKIVQTSALLNGRLEAWVDDLWALRLHFHLRSDLPREKVEGILREEMNLLASYDRLKMLTSELLNAEAENLRTVLHELSNYLKVYDDQLVVNEVKKACELKISHLNAQLSNEILSREVSWNWLKRIEQLTGAIRSLGVIAGTPQSLKELEAVTSVEAQLPKELFAQLTFGDSPLSQELRDLSKKVASKNNTKEAFVPAMNSYVHLQKRKQGYLIKLTFEINESTPTQFDSFWKSRCDIERIGRDALKERLSHGT